jgi:hypothetical protein
VALMAFQTHVSLNYATHLPALMRALTLTDGAVLELGMGLFSTPFLHYACQLAGERPLMSVENDERWAKQFETYRRPWHHIVSVEDWDDFDIEGEFFPDDTGYVWDVALVDHSPSARRVVDIKRLAHCARLIIAHDSNGRYENDYHYSTIYPLFRYRTDWTGDGRHAAVLSNFVDLERFWE